MFKLDLAITKPLAGGCPFTILHRRVRAAAQFGAQIWQQDDMLRLRYMWRMGGRAGKRKVNSL
jgi:hypothetical protein